MESITLIDPGCELLGRYPTGRSWCNRLLSPSMCAVLSAGAVREVTYDDSVLVYYCLPPQAAPESRAICSVSRYCWNLTARPSRIVQM
jgi:hypothetical protein